MAEIPDTDDRASSEEQPLVAADDAVIGRAFRLSMVALAACAVIAAGAVLLLRDRSAETPVETAEYTPASVQTRVATPPVVRFTDVTEEAGIRFRHENGARGRKLLPETMGSGCAFLDHDSDGDQDLLLVNASTWPDDPQPETPPVMALYRNDGGLRFTDVAAAVGLAVPFYGQGVAVGDYDNDGDADIYVTAVGENRLFRNNVGRFEDVTAAAGVAGGADDWGTSAGFFDADNDGDLDLYVCNYVRWSVEKDMQVDYRLTGVGRAYGPPTDYQGTVPLYFRSEGNGTFVEAAKDAGFHVTNPATGAPAAKALAILPFDVDRDGWIDLLVANDTVRNFLFHNRGDGTFEEIGEEAGVAYDGNGAATGAMGIDGAYHRNDGTLAFGIGNFANEMTSFYVSVGTPSRDLLLFSDEAITEGIGSVSRQLLSFGFFFFDYDLDGRQDIFQTNGHLEEEINKVQPSQHYRQPSQLFWNCGPTFTSCYVPVDGELTGDLARPVVGRGATYADLDGDGDLDVVITQTGDRALLLRNDQTTGHHWLRLRLAGTTSNRDALGAFVEVDVGGETQRQQVMPTRSYLSQTERTLTFGLGERTSADAVRVFWPGRTKPVDLGTLEGGRTIEVKEP